MTKFLALGLLGAIAFAPIANAAVITGTTVSSYSSQFTGGGSDREASNVVGGTGFNATPGAYSNVPEGNMWMTVGNGSAGYGVDTNPYITFDLGSVYNLNSVSVWNYNENSGNPALYTSRGVQSMTVLISTDNVTYASIGNFNLTQATGSDTTAFAQALTLSGSAEFIRFANLTSFGAGDADPYGFVGLSQVVFNGTASAAVPEPASLILVGAGLAAAFAARRRSGASV